MRRESASRSLVVVVALLGFDCAWLAPCRAAAQQTGLGAVRGVVRSAQEGTPIQGVIVSVRGTGLGTVTAAQGRYSLTRVPAGAQTLVFRVIGFAPEELLVSVAEGGTATYDVALALRPIQLSEIEVISASRVPERIVEAPAAVSSIDPNLLRNLAPTGQLALALAAVPGVDIIQSGMNQFDINARGMIQTFNRRLLVLVDGRDVADPLFGSPIEWNSMSPLDEASRMELVRGPGSALYGANAFSGVLDIRTPAPRDIQGSRITVSGGEPSSYQADLRNAGVLAGGRLDYRVNVGFRRSDSWARSRTAIDSLDLAREYAGATDQMIPKIRDVLPLNGQYLGPNDVALGQPDPLKSTYGAARLDWYGRSGWVATAEAGTARGENELYLSPAGRIQRTIDRPWARLNLGSERYNLMAWYTGDQSVVPYHNLTSGTTLEQHEGAYAVEGQFNRPIAGGRARLVAGASYRHQHINTDSTFFVAADDNRHDAAWAVFGQLEGRITPLLRAVAAARWDQGSLFSGQFSPKLALVFTPRQGHAIRATFNQAFRAPTSIDLFGRSAFGPAQTRPGSLETNLDAYMGSVSSAVTGGSLPGSVIAGLDVGALPWHFDSLTPSQVRGNRNLQVEHVASWELGYKGEIGGRSFVTVDVYHEDMRNFITSALPGGVNPDFPLFALDSGRTVSVVATLDSLDARLAAQGRPTTDPLRAAIPGLISSFTSLNTSIATTLSTLPDGRRALVRSFTNAGHVITQGVDVGGSVALTPALHLDGSVSLLDFTVLDVHTGDAIRSNTARWKGSLALAYAGTRADLNVTARFVGAYDWALGAFVGTVPASQTVNVAGGYRVNRNLRFHAVVTNFFDQQRFHSFGGSVIGRGALVGMTTDF